MRSKGSLRQHLPFPPTPFPAWGMGDSIYNLYIKMRLRHLYKRRLIPLREAVLWLFGRGGSDALGVLGHSPKCVLVWGPRRDARPAGERRSGEALEGCLAHRDSDPTWSAARDDAHE